MESPRTNPAVAQLTNGHLSETIFSFNKNSKPVCAIVGVGPGLGSANAKRFSDAGFSLALLSRNSTFTSKLAAELPDARPYTCDVTDTGKIKEVFQTIAQDLGPVDVLIYSASSRFQAQGSHGNIEVATEEDMAHAWKIDTLGCMMCCKQVVPSMVERGTGTILIIGATGSLRGGANFTAFAAAKNGQRALAESMARHLMPKGVHVSLLIIDGSIDADRSGSEKLIKAEQVSDTLMFLHSQHKSGWTFQMDIRPNVERW